MLFSDDDSAAPRITLVKTELLDVLAVAAAEESTEGLKQIIAGLKTAVQRKPVIVTGRSDEPSESVSFRQDVLLSELDQILEAQTLERAQYYLKRLNRGACSSRNGRVNEINLLRWKEYPEVITDSLWVFPKRDASGAHLGWYWGNFVPQIPHQMIMRYTKKGDWVLDPFAGSGTTLIECRRLGRNGIGVELNEDVAERALDLVEAEPNRGSVVTEIAVGDARTIDFKKLLQNHGAKKAGLLVLHPPYADIIKFSDDIRDLSVAPTTEEFLKMFGEVVDNVTPLLEKGRYCALVVGDKYSKGEWIPLGFYCMEEMRKRGYQLKSVVVKNFEETRSKRDQKQLWRYRALVGGFYVFKHEYVFVLQKR
ncbi:MAG: TRM11 family SAM-dependent methyltransferase [Blastocatellia bacterium]